MNYCNDASKEAESLKIEAVVVSVGFDDMLDYTLDLNHPHFDTMVVVTSFDDKKTQAVAKKHGATCVQTDLFRKNGRKFNKGAAINAGFSHFQFHGWRLHMDADIALPDNFRRLLFNHTHLEQSCVYGADRINVVAPNHLKVAAHQQHKHGVLLEAEEPHPIGARYVCTLHGYVPLGYFQLWHASCQKRYPHSLGTAEHDDIMFGTLWPQSHRRVLPTALVHHICTHNPKWGENWNGDRKMPRLDA